MKESPGAVVYRRYQKLLQGEKANHFLALKSYQDAPSADTNPNVSTASNYFV
jgi:hypothetical protein